MRTQQTKQLKILVNIHLDENGEIVIQPDSIIPNIYDPQQLNIYAFERGNPYSYVDPSGNFIEDAPFIALDILDIIENPNSKSNWAALGIDTALLLAPGIGGAGFIGKNVAKAGEFANSLKNSEKILRETGQVEVKSFQEANKLRELVAPAAKQVPGAGPQMTKSSESLFKNDNVYKTDYLFDKDTGRIYGHGETNPHAFNPHINIKSGKEKFTIIINKIKDLIR